MSEPQVHALGPCLRGQTAANIHMALGYKAATVRACATLSKKPRSTRIKAVAVKVDEQTRADGKKRHVVKATAKGKVLATAPWH